MALKSPLILSRPPPGPRCARPEDKLRGRVEGRKALIQPSRLRATALVQAAPIGL
jgi:hypothetical protein